MKKRSHHTHAVPPKEDSPAALLKHAAMGAGVSLGIGTILLLTATGICCATKDPLSYTKAVGMIVLYGTALIGGFISVRFHRGAPLPVGSICGILLALFFLIFTLFWKEEVSSQFSFGITLLLRVLIPLASVLGALLGSHSPSSSKHKHSSR